MDALTKHNGDKKKKAVQSYTLVHSCDMSETMRNETVEIITNACEKFGTNDYKAPKEIKEVLDKKYGPKWHAVVGDAFGVHAVHQINTTMFGFFGTNLCICVWKT